MAERIYSLRSIAAVATAALLSIGTPAGALAAAKDGAKPITVRLPATAIKDERSNICMPRTLIDKARKSSLPDTMCQTRDEWAARGVTIVTK